MLLKTFSELSTKTSLCACSSRYYIGAVWEVEKRIVTFLVQCIGIKDRKNPLFSQNQSSSLWAPLKKHHRKNCRHCFVEERAHETFYFGGERQLCEKNSVWCVRILLRNRVSQKNEQLICACKKKSSSRHAMHVRKKERKKWFRNDACCLLTQKQPQNKM